MDASTGIVAITIPSGQVTLSDRRTQRRWSVELASYQLAVFPVTQAQYTQTTGQRPRGPVACRKCFLVGRGPVLQRLSPRWRIGRRQVATDSLNQR